MNIKPDSIPTEIIPLTEETVDEINKVVHFGDNVFVHLKDGRSVVGKMLPAGWDPRLDSFTVGTSDEVFVPDDIKSIRVV